jgi:hypothetical protein
MRPGIHGGKSIGIILTQNDPITVHGIDDEKTTDNEPLKRPEFQAWQFRCFLKLDESGVDCSLSIGGKLFAARMKLGSMRSWVTRRSHG